MDEELPLDINCLPKNNKKCVNNTYVLKLKKKCKHVTYLRRKMFGSNSKFHILNNFTFLNLLHSIPVSHESHLIEEFAS